MSYQLTPDHQQQLVNLRADITAIEKELAKAERAGLNVQTLREQLQRMETMRTGLLREYGGPGASGRRRS